MVKTKEFEIKKKAGLLASEVLPGKDLDKALLIVPNGVQASAGGAAKESCLCQGGG